MVLSAPRSASTWAANWLTTDRSLCLHDPILEHLPDEMDQIPCDRMLGVACTGLGLLTDLVNAHSARKVIVHRDLRDVNKSLEAIGLSRLGPLWLSALHKIDGMHVDFADLFEANKACYIYEHLLGRRFDAARHWELCKIHVEPNFAKVKIVPGRAREFRRRVEESFA